MEKKTYEKRGNPFYFNNSWNTEYYRFDCFGVRSRKRKSGFTTEYEAYEALQCQLFLWGKGDRAPRVKSDILFWEYMNCWFENNYTNQIQRKTAIKYRYTLNILQSELSPDLLLKNLNRPDIERLLLIINKKAPGYVKSVKDILYACCQYALLCGVLEENPVSNVHMPSKIKHPPHILTEKDYFCLLNAAMKTSNCLEFLLAMLMGLTKQEIIQLQYKDIDLEQGLMKLYTGHPRSLKIPPSVFTEIQRRKNEYASHRLKTYVSCQKNGLMRSEGYLNIALNRLIKETGVPHVTFRNLRDSMAYLLLKNDFGLLTVSRLFGYVGYKSAENRFGYLTEFIKECKPQSFSDFFGGYDVI